MKHQIENLTWEDLDNMVEEDPLELRNRAWAAISARDAEIARLREQLRLANIEQVATEATLNEHEAIVQAAIAVAETYRPREMEDERVVDWDLLEALVTEVRR